MAAISPVLSELESFIHNSYNSVLDNLRSSHLNFGISETPFSIYITIRKSLKKSSFTKFSSQVPSKLVQDVPVSKIKSRCKFLEDANEALKIDLDYAVTENEAHVKTICDLETKVENLVQKLTETEKQFGTKVAEAVKATVAERRSIQIKHEQICVESKNIKSENEELKKDVNSLNVALKSAKKETKETHFKLEKKVKEMEGKIETLQEYKLAKASDEKELKSK